MRCNHEQSETVIDAKRLQDGKVVAIKRVPPNTYEAKIVCMLSSHQRLKDPRNHCVPIYDHFPDTRTPDGGSFIVMPLLRAFNEPPFAYVDEVIDFVRQTLEASTVLPFFGLYLSPLFEGSRLHAQSRCCPPVFRPFFSGLGSC